MTLLRQKMIDAMLVRGLPPPPRTHRSYLRAVNDLAKYYGGMTHQPPVAARGLIPPIDHRVCFRRNRLLSVFHFRLYFIHLRRTRIHLSNSVNR